jgi:hypothetical protein
LGAINTSILPFVKRFNDIWLKLIGFERKMVEKRWDLKTKIESGFIKQEFKEIAQVTITF